jgi:hypothetical protein
MNELQVQKNRDKVKRYQDRLRKENPGKLKHQQRKSNLKKLYGMTIEDYNSMFEKQNGQCAICGKAYKGTLHIDHNHRTGKIRELLCPACNYLVSVVEDITLLLKIQNYIAKHDDSVSS